MNIDKSSNVNFEEIGNFLDTFFFNDERIKNTIEEVGFTVPQIKVVNTLIVSALKAYDLQKQQ